MAKPKGSMNKVTHVPGPPKKTRQGCSPNDTDLGYFSQWKAEEI